MRAGGVTAGGRSPVFSSPCHRWAPACGAVGLLSLSSLPLCQICSSPHPCTIPAVLLGSHRHSQLFPRALHPAPGWLPGHCACSPECGLHLLSGLPKAAVGGLLRLFQVWRRCRKEQEVRAQPGKDLSSHRDQPKTLLFEPVTFHRIFPRIRSHTTCTSPGLLALFCTGCDHTSVALEWQERKGHPALLICSLG